MGQIFDLTWQWITIVYVIVLSNDFQNNCLEQKAGKYIRNDLISEIRFYFCVYSFWFMYLNSGKTNGSKYKQTIPY